jgi:hypothetical protein
MEGIKEVQGKTKRTRPPRGAAGRSLHSHPYSHPWEVRRQAVQLCLEESFPVERWPAKWAWAVAPCPSG